MKIMAIDPGVNGGIAVYDTVAKIATAENMPVPPGDLSECIEVYKPDVCYLEKVGGMPGQGGSAMFNFGYGFGCLNQCLYDHHIKTITVTPQKWQKALQLGTRKKSQSKTEWKNKLKAKAQQLYPDIKVTLKTSDALLILEYARITERE